MLKDSKNKEKLEIDENIQKAKRNKRERERECVCFNGTRKFDKKYTIQFYGVFYSLLQKLFFTQIHFPFLSIA